MANKEAPAGRENEIKSNPYVLSTEERTAPEDEIKEWFDNRVALQREGIEQQGIQPQLLFGLPPVLRLEWRRKVWGYYLSTLSSYERWLIRGTERPTKGHHTHKHPFFGYGIPGDEEMGSSLIND